MSLTRLFITLLLLQTLANHSLAFADSITIIVNNHNDVRALTTAELAKIYAGKTLKWKDGQNILAIDRTDGSSIRATFDKAVIESSADKTMLTSRAQAPFQHLVLDTDRAVIQFVSTMPNAIGYIYSNQSNDSAVKVILVDGYMPSERGYRIN